MVPTVPPPSPPSPLLLILPKGAQISLILVEVLRISISTFSYRISTGSSIIQLVEVRVPSGGITFRLQEYLHQFSISFEHENRFGGGSGDGGGSTTSASVQRLFHISFSLLIGLLAMMMDRTVITVI